MGKRKGKNSGTQAGTGTEASVDPSDPKQLMALLQGNKGWLAMVLLSLFLLLALLGAVGSMFFVFDLRSGTLAAVFAGLGAGYASLRRFALNRMKGLMGYDTVALLAALDEIFNSLGVTTMDAARKKLTQILEDSNGLTELLTALERKHFSSGLNRAKELVLLPPKAALLTQVVTELGLEDDSTVLAEVKKVMTGQQHARQLFELLGCEKFGDAKKKLLAMLQPVEIVPAPFFEGLTDDEARRRLSGYPATQVELAALREQGQRLKNVEEELTATRNSLDQANRDLESANGRLGWMTAQASLPWKMLASLGVVSRSDKPNLGELQALLEPRSSINLSSGNAELHRGARRLRREVERLLAAHCIAAELGVAGKWTELGKIFLPLCRKSALAEVLPRLDTSVQVWYSENTALPKPE